MTSNSVSSNILAIAAESRYIGLDQLVVAFCRCPHIGPFYRGEVKIIESSTTVTRQPPSATDVDQCEPINPAPPVIQDF
jgi:hypothetical protein